MIILAHRGLWRRDSEQNSLGALGDAVRAGFGVETDLRDRDRRVVISHDPPAGPCPTLDDLLAIYAAAGTRQPLALNIKADGLQDLIGESLQRHGIRAESYFLFDMSPPDALGYLGRKMPCFTRESEIEPVPAFIDQAAGVWLDCFFEDRINRDSVAKHLGAGRDVAVVSPELHGRDKAVAWAAWRDVERDLGAQGSGKLMICTDFPEEARGYFGER